jgi:hypothetical protein
LQIMHWFGDKFRFVKMSFKCFLSFTLWVQMMWLSHCFVPSGPVLFCKTEEEKDICDLSKTNQTFFLKHLLISLQLSKTCLLQSTPLHYLHCIQYFFQFWNTSGNLFSRIAYRLYRELASISAIIWNCWRGFQPQEQK